MRFRRRRRQGLGRRHGDCATSLRAMPDSACRRDFCPLMFIDTMRPRAATRLSVAAAPLRATRLSAASLASPFTRLRSRKPGVGE